MDYQVNQTKITIHSNTVDLHHNIFRVLTVQGVSIRQTGPFSTSKLSSKTAPGCGG